MIRKVGDGGAFGFGVNVSVEVPGGVVEVEVVVVEEQLRLDSWHHGPSDHERKQPLMQHHNQSHRS